MAGGAMRQQNRSVVMARGGMVASAHPLVSAAGADPGVSPCWSCVTDALARSAGGSACWPGGALASVACTCGVPAAAGT